MPLRLTEKQAREWFDKSGIELEDNAPLPPLQSAAKGVSSVLVLGLIAGRAMGIAFGAAAVFSVAYMYLAMAA